jgi:hypothetical protein
MMALWLFWVLVADKREKTQKEKKKKKKLVFEVNQIKRSNNQLNSSLTLPVQVLVYLSSLISH